MGDKLRGETILRCWATTSWQNSFHMPCCCFDDGGREHCLTRRSKIGGSYPERDHSHQDRNVFMIA